MSKVVKELLEGGPTCSLVDAIKALGISRGHGYALARSGEFPVKVLRLGTTYRVVTADLLRLLDLDEVA
ncbi:MULTISPECIES: DNA-binding protein [Rhodococcus]|uniref:DNA-binding protein n=1 Tax=Rhodococcus TaxID=1827 RepID=UPI00193BC3D7|nr:MULTISPECIES: DNA-binding protein [Rhodococcus]QRI76270.1 DNA-binding protein [Rhodococcus aetherivorans]QSE59681.1 DNA-binding protein [Rhodococcus sp. PSBB066]